MERMFKVGQKLEVTDNTGKPIDKVENIEILEILEDGPYGPDYLVLTDKPDARAIGNFGLEDAKKVTWALDQAVKDELIFVKVLEEA